jgi:hypothetical protein
MDFMPFLMTRIAKTFAGRSSGIPDNAHLIVVPNSLVDQWESELRRFLRGDAIDIVRVRSGQKYWAEDMNRIREGMEVRPAIRHIVLVPHSVGFTARNSYRKCANCVA